MTAASTVGPERGPTTADTSSARSLHHLTVVTPEGVVLSFRAAGVASRSLAKGIDFLIQFVALIAALFIAGFTAVINGAAGIVMIVVLLFLIFYGYGAVLETMWDGRTVGKRVFGIRVLTAEGGPVRLRHAAIRSMIATFDFWFPTPGGLVALFFALLTPRSQRLGDLAAGTIVIREPRGGERPVYFPAPAGSVIGAGTLDTSALAPRQYALVRELLLRVGELVPEARHALTSQAADRVAATIGQPRPSAMTGEAYLMAVLHAHQVRFWPEAIAAQPPPPMAGHPGPARPGRQ